MASKTSVGLLNEFYQKHHRSIKEPFYEYAEQLVDGRKSFTASCDFNNHLTKGTAFSKNEAKRLAAEKMLDIFDVRCTKEPTKQKPPPNTSTPLNCKIQEEFDKDRLNDHFDNYLETREKDYSKFRRLFVGDIEENCTNQFEDLHNGFKTANAPKSKTLGSLIQRGVDYIDFGVACDIFKAIVDEMGLIYYAEFVETAKNDAYVVSIKVNYNSLTAFGAGREPAEAIQSSCRNAIAFIVTFNS